MQVNPTHLSEWTGNFAHLVFAGLSLLIPQGDIYSLEPAIDMRPSTANNGSVGQFKQSGMEWSLYALSADLTLLEHCPESYRIAILMKNVQPIYGLLCEQVNTVTRNEISIYPIPAAMYSEDSPLLALALYDNEVRYISSALALGRLFSQ